MERSYDAREGLFWNLVGKREEPIRVKTIVSLMPLILEDLPRTAVESLVEHLANPDEFWLDYPVASTARDEPAFAPTRTRLIWRGPMSMNTNWFLAHGLRSHGYPDLAESIGERSRELVERHGFNEFYNPLHGRAGRRRDVRLGDARHRPVGPSPPCPRCARRCGGPPRRR